MSRCKFVIVFFKKNFLFIRMIEISILGKFAWNVFYCIDCDRVRIWGNINVICVG